MFAIPDSPTPKNDGINVVILLFLCLHNVFVSHFSISCSEGTESGLFKTVTGKAQRFNNSATSQHVCLVSFQTS